MPNKFQTFYDKLTAPVPYTGFNSLEENPISEALSNLGAGVFQIPAPLVHPIQTGKTLMGLAGAGLGTPNQFTQPAEEGLIKPFIKGPNESGKKYISRLGGIATTMLPSIALGSELSGESPIPEAPTAKLIPFGKSPESLDISNGLRYTSADANKILDNYNAFQKPSHLGEINRGLQLVKNPHEPTFVKPETPENFGFEGLKNSLMSPQPWDSTDLDTPSFMRPNDAWMNQPVEKIGLDEFRKDNVIPFRNKETEISPEGDTEASHKIPPDIQELKWSGSKPQGYHTVQPTLDPSHPNYRGPREGGTFRKLLEEPEFREDYINGLPKMANQINSLMNPKLFKPITSTQQLNEMYPHLGENTITEAQFNKLYPDFNPMPSYLEAPITDPSKFNLNTPITSTDQFLKLFPH